MCICICTIKGLSPTCTHVCMDQDTCNAYWNCKQNDTCTCTYMHVHCMYMLYNFPLHVHVYIHVTCHHLSMYMYTCMYMYMCILYYIFRW